MFWSPWAAMTQYHRLSGLNSRHLFVHPSSGGWTSGVWEPVWLGSSEGSFLPYTQGTLSSCACVAERERGRFLESEKDTHPIVMAPPT